MGSKKQVATPDKPDYTPAIDGEAISGCISDIFFLTIVIIVLFIGSAIIAFALIVGDVLILGKHIDVIRSADKVPVIYSWVVLAIDFGIVALFWNIILDNLILDPMASITQDMTEGERLEHYASGRAVYLLGIMILDGLTLVIFLFITQKIGFKYLRFTVADVALTIVVMLLVTFVCWLFDKQGMYFVLMIRSRAVRWLNSLGHKIGF